MLVACHSHGIKPFVTFHHFSSPQWLIKAGGWESDDTPALFARYCGRLAADLGDLIAGGCTINDGQYRPCFDFLRRTAAHGSNPSFTGLGRSL